MVLSLVLNYCCVLCFFVELGTATADAASTTSTIATADAASTTSTASAIATVATAEVAGTVDATVVVAVVGRHLRSISLANFVKSI